MAKRTSTWFRQPSLWIVLVAGVLFITFSIAIVRELINSHQVRQQVQRLQNQVADEEHRQRQLQDLIDYLGSPTFREQEARLKLGLKKQDERVLVVPTNGSATNSTDAAGVTNTSSTPTTPATRPAEWWQYFFGPRQT
jgi:cell division protein FtsL